MANRHFAKLADVWKHLPLVEILAHESPELYWESHAGSGAYPMMVDPERRFGALGLWERAARSVPLDRSRYLRQLRQLNPTTELRVYPGSAVFAMSELGGRARYLLCDLDRESVSDLCAWAEKLGLADRVNAVVGNGMDVLHEALGGSSSSRLLVHIDPFDPWATGSAGWSALDLAGEVVQAGAQLVYWYGYDRPQRRAWALDEIARRTDIELWCGDVLVRAANDPAIPPDGNLGIATTPGTGFGVVCGNLARSTLEACSDLGAALADTWHDVPLPAGTAGRLEFLVTARH